MHAPAVTGARVLRRTVASQAGRVTASAVLSAAHQGGEALVPVLVGVVIDRAVATGTSGALLSWIGVLAATFLGLSFSFRFGARTGELAAERAAHRLRIELTARILDPRGGADTGRLPGALVSVATTDAQRVGMVNLALALGVAAAAGMLVGAVALLRVSLPLGLLVLLGTPLMLGLAHLLGRPLQRRSEAEQERAAHTAGVAADLVDGLRVLKGIGAERAAAARYRSASRASHDASLHAARAKSRHDGTLLIVGGLFLALVALVGGRLAAGGDISIGGLVAAVGLAQFLLGPLSVLAWVNTELAQGRASAARIAGVLAAAPSAGGSAPLPVPVTGTLRVRGLCHDGLRDLTFDIAPRRLTGIVTADPADADALLACLGRERDPDAGSIELDGHPLSTVDPDAARAAVLVAAHDADLFEGSLYENVAGTGTDAALVARALAASGADEVARTLPGGVNGPVGERGRSLSGGQRQRVALARALAADPGVLVLHEPTTAVDAVTELRIADGVRALRAGRTTVVVTTSPALLAAADDVVFIAGGAVAATGPHGRLVRDHPAYRLAVLS